MFLDPDYFINASFSDHLVYKTGFAFFFFPI